jgi:hypothetical protein
VNLSPRELYERYAQAVAYVAVKRPDGTATIGTAFHVGNGVFVSAAHLLAAGELVEIATTTSMYVPDPDGTTSLGNREGRFRLVTPSKGQLVSGPHLHPDKNIDVGAIVVKGIDAPTIPLGFHLDDMLADEQFVLRRVLVMGYPPVPLSSEPILIATEAEVNAVVDKYIGGRHPHFVVSATPRGGFSGGPCLIEWDFALGVVTEALVMNHAPSELGFMAVLTVEPILTCLEHHGIMPDCQRDERLS